MKYIKLFENYNYEKIFDWMKEYAPRVKNFVINSDGSVDIDGCFSFHKGENAGIINGELPIKIRYADCVFADNIGLKTLKNFPEKISEDYDVTPIDSNGYYWIQNNKLTTLEGCPKKVKRFIASDNELTSLKGAPEYVHDVCYLQNNQLESMEGCPKYIGLRLDIYNNPIKSLIGIPPDFMIGAGDWNVNKSVLNYEEKVGVYSFKINYKILDEYWNDVLKNNPECAKSLYIKEPDIDGNFNSTITISNMLYNKYKHLFRGNKSGLLNLK